jgi:hypothetical protein
VKYLHGRRVHASIIQKGTRMMKVAKAMFAKIWWLGRGTATVMGVAMLLALTVGLASTALAGTGVGARLDLGKTNTVSAVTSLVGSVAGSSLKIDNNSTGTGATALRLEVEPGKPPMSVNSTTEVQGLNVDSLDGFTSSEFLQESTDRDDFLPSRIYTASTQVTGPGGGLAERQGAFCDFGDTVLGGGGGTRENDGRDDDLLLSEPVGTGGWSATIRDNGTRSTVFGEALCADLPPLRP